MQIAQEKLRIIEERRSIRKFTATPVPQPLVLELIRYAALAPSATNRQAWRFIVVRDAALKRALVDAGASTIIERAPCGILVLYENTIRGRHYHDDYQSAAACIQNLLLAAQAYALGACWICHLPSKSFLRKLFNIPAQYAPVAYIALGYPQINVRRDVPRKYAPEEIVFENRFAQREHDEGLRAGRFKILLERLLIRLYYHIPVCVKKKYVNSIIERKFTKKFEN